MTAVFQGANCTREADKWLRQQNYKGRVMKYNVRHAVNYVTGLITEVAISNITYHFGRGTPIQRGIV